MVYIQQTVKHKIHPISGKYKRLGKHIVINTGRKTKEGKIIWRSVGSFKK